MKMKALSAILVVVLLVISLVGIVLGEMNIETEVAIEGNGVIIDKEMSVQTDKDYQGIKFYDEFLTPGLGAHGQSNVSLVESTSILLAKDSTLKVYGGIESDRVQADACLKNYELGVRQSNRYIGDSVVDFHWMTSNVTSEMSYAGSFVGKDRSTILVRNLTNPHYMIYDDDLSVEGKFDLDLSSVVTMSVSEGDEGDWLGCP